MFKDSNQWDQAIAFNGAEASCCCPTCLGCRGCADGLRNDLWLDLKSPRYPIEILVRKASAQEVIEGCAARGGTKVDQVFPAVGVPGQSRIAVLKGRSEAAPC